MGRDDGLQPWKLQPKDTSQSIVTGEVFNGFARKRFQTLRLMVYRRATVPADVMATPRPYVAGAIGFQLVRRTGDAFTSRVFHLGANEGLEIDISAASDATLTAWQAALPGYAVDAWLDPAPIAGSFPTVARYFQRIAGAADFGTPPGATEVRLSSVDAAWSWLGWNGAPVTFPEAATYQGGTVRGFGFRPSGPRDLSWTISF